MGPVKKYSDGSSGTDRSSSHALDALDFLATKVNFCDYGVERWAANPGARSLTLQVRGEMVENTYDVRWFEITYTGVSEIRFEPGPSEVPARDPLEVASTEVKRIDTEDAVYEFRWDFGDGTARIIRFCAVAFRYLEQPEPERNAVRAGMLYAEGQKALAVKDYRLAAKAFAESLALTPDHTTTKFLLAKSRYYLGEYVAAQTLLQEILAEQPMNPGALSYQKRVREAIKP